jgi:hypothetical protein
MMQANLLRLDSPSARKIPGELTGIALGCGLATKWTFKDFSFFTPLLASTDRPGPHDPNGNGNQGIVRQAFTPLTLWSGNESRDH